MTDYLGGRAVKSQFSTQTPSVPQPLNAGPQVFMHLSPGCSKCIIIKIQPVVGLHCDFRVSCGLELLLLKLLLLDFCSFLQGECAVVMSLLYFGTTVILR